MERNTRRLPPWMLAGASSGETDDKGVEGKRRHEPEAPKTKAQKRPRRTVKPKERDDSDESTKMKIRTRGGERVRNKIPVEYEGQEAKLDCKNLENIESVTDPNDDYLTVDDLISFAQEYVKAEEDQTIEGQESLSISESMIVVDQSNLGNGTRDPTADDMLDLLLGPFFKKTSTEQQSS